MLHGLGGERSSMNAAAETHLAPYGYAVLTVDARGHGASGGQSSLVGPREVADYAAALAWLRAPAGRQRQVRRSLRRLPRRRLGLEAADCSRRPSRRGRPGDDMDEPLRLAAPARPRQVRSRHLLPQPAPPGALGSRGHDAQGRRAAGTEPGRHPRVRRHALGAPGPGEDPDACLHDPGTARLRVRHAGGSQRVRPAPGAEAALPRRPGPHAGHESRRRADVLLRPGPDVVRPLPQGPAERNRHPAAASNSHPIPGAQGRTRAKSRRPGACSASAFAAGRRSPGSAR